MKIEAITGSQWPCTVLYRSVPSRSTVATVLAVGRRRCCITESTWLWPAVVQNRRALVPPPNAHCRHRLLYLFALWCMYFCIVRVFFNGGSINRLEKTRKVDWLHIKKLSSSLSYFYDIETRAREWCSDRILKNTDRCIWQLHPFCDYLFRCYWGNLSFSNKRVKLSCYIETIT